MRFSVALLAGLAASLAAQEVAIQNIKIEAPKQKNPTTQTVINDEISQNSPTLDLASALSNSFVEIDLIRKGAVGNEIGIRGFSKENLPVLLDGGFLEGACEARKDSALSLIGARDVGHIEIVEGPYDVTRPSALGGSVNVVSKRATQTQFSKLFFTLGSFSYTSYAAEVGGGNKNIGATAGVGNSKSGVYRDAKGRKQTHIADYLPDRDDNAFSKNESWIKFAIPLSERADAQIGYSHSDARDVLAPAVGEDTFVQKTHLLNGDFRLHGILSADDEALLKLYKNYVFHEAGDLYRVDGGDQSRFVSDFTGAKLEYSQKTVNGVFTVGGDLHNRKWYSKDMQGGYTGVIANTNTKLIGLYAKSTINTLGWSFDCGARADGATISADGGLLGDALKSISIQNSRKIGLGGAFATARYSFDGATSVFAAIGRSQRTPTAQELFFQAEDGSKLGNPNLKAPANTQLDIGAQGFLKDAKLSAKIFYSSLKNHIYLGRKNIDSQDRLLYENIDAKIYGGDAQAIMPFADIYYVQLGISAQNGEKLSFPSGNQNRYLAEIAPLKTRLIVAVDDAALAASAEWTHGIGQTRIDDSAGELPLDGYDVVNLRISYTLGRLKLRGGVENLFNKLYANSNSYYKDALTTSQPRVVYESGRSFYFGADYSF